METIKHNPARLYNCDESDITIVQHKHTKILGLNGKRQIPSLQSAERGLLVTVVNCMSPTGHFIPPLLVFPRKNMKQELMNGTPPGSIYACHPSVWIQSEKFSQLFLHFIKDTKPTKEDPVVLVLDGHYSHTRNLEVITLARENHVDIICLPPPSSHIILPLDKDFMGPLKTFYCQEIEKWLCSHPGRVVTVYQIGELFRSAYKRASTGEIAVNGSRATGLFPCDKNFFRPHDFPLSSKDKDASPVNHPALVKTCGQTSFSSGNFSALTSAEALRSAAISLVPSLNLKPNLRGGTAKQIISSPYKKFFEATHKKKIKQPTKSKTSRPASNALLGPSKRRKGKVCRDPAPSDTPSDSNTGLAFPFAEDSMEGDDEQDADCVFCTGRFSEDHNRED